MKKLQEFSVVAYKDSGHVAMKVVVEADSKERALEIFKYRCDPPDSYTFHVKEI